MCSSDLGHIHLLPGLFSEMMNVPNVAFSGPLFRTVAVVQALEFILQLHDDGQPGSLAEVNGPDGGLVVRIPGRVEPRVLYTNRV